MDEKTLKELSIGMEDASDIIVYETGKLGLKNLMTGKESDELKDVIGNRRFIMLSKESVEHTITGYYAKYVKEDGMEALVVLDAYFDGSGWVEINRHAFYGDSKKIDLYDTEKEIIHYAGNAMPFAHICGGAIDICGQAAVEDYGKDSVWVNLEKRNVDAGFTEQCNLFFQGKVLFGSNWTKIGYSYEEIGKKQLDSVVSAASVGASVERGYVFNENCGYYKKLDKTKLPEPPRKFFLRICIMAYAKLFEISPCDRADFYTNGRMEFYYLQNTDGIALLRCFVVRPTAGRTSALAGIVCYEESHLSLSGCAEISRGPRIILYADDMEGTSVQYNCGPLNEWLSSLDALLEDGISMAARRVRTAEAEFQGKYGFTPDRIWNFMWVISKNPAIERLEKANYENSESIRRFLHGAVCQDSITCDEDLEQIFGRIDVCASSLNRMLKIPKGMLELAGKYCMPEVIRYIKDAFSDNMDYLVNMNREDMTSLFLFFKETMRSSGPLNADSAAAILKNLFFIYGCENWKTYAAHMVSKLQDYPKEPKQYLDYIQTLTIIGPQIAKTFNWKVSGESLQKEIGTLQPIRDAFCNLNKREDYDEKLRTRAGELSKFAYEKDGFVIKWPENSYEIISEGIKLHHCAKDFIGVAAEGWTDLLFIRRKEEPDKPFYTLEIKSGCLRQCHGFGNCDIHNADGLEEFLKEFCEEKGILYAEGSERLGV